LLILCAVAAGLAQEPAAEPEPEETYIGSEMCGMCHEDIALDFETSSHARIALEKAGKWEGQECETCHGPGGTHAESMDAETIFGFKNVEPGRVNQACLECHSGQQTHSGRLTTEAHFRNALDCTSCHKVHASDGPSLLTAEKNELCSSCHASVRAAFNRPFTHRLAQGAMECVDCHNPHGGTPPDAMPRFSANENGCLRCHADKRGPFPFEHAPVKMEPCSTCHEPHGSSNPRMMTRHIVSQLCLECHTTSVSTLGGSPPSLHDMRSPRFRACTTCHSKIHGSFVSPDFLR
jgi:DmsE family decaheme c-type cytochrome